jgi:hypothetical protein
MYVATLALGLCDQHLCLWIVLSAVGLCDQLLCLWTVLTAVCCSKELNAFRHYSIF